MIYINNSEIFFYNIILWMHQWIKWMTYKSTHFLRRYIISNKRYHIFSSIKFHNILPLSARELNTCPYCQTSCPPLDCTVPHRRECRRNRVIFPLIIIQSKTVFGQLNWARRTGCLQAPNGRAFVLLRFKACWQLNGLETWRG